MTYTVTLTGCPGLAETSKTQAEDAFRAALEIALNGGPAAVVLAARASDEAFDRHGGTLSIDAPAADRDAVDRWTDALGAAREAAFVGWPVAPSSAHFAVQLGG